MDFDPAELDTLSREDLILRARARGVERPEQMTRVELRDEIVRLSEPDLERQRRSRGWLGVARDLLASVVESGLNLPDAAAAIRGEGKGDGDFQGPPPVATVTLAEIYATQGHYEQALRMLDEVIEREPEHATARTLRDRIAQERDLGPGRRRKVVDTKADPILTPQAPAVALAVEEPAPPAVAVVAPVPAPEPVSAPPVAVVAPVPAPEPVSAPPVAVVAPVPAPEPVSAPPVAVVAPVPAPEPVSAPPVAVVAPVPAPEPVSAPPVAVVAPVPAPEPVSAPPVPAVLVAPEPAPAAAPPAAAPPAAVVAQPEPEPEPEAAGAPLHPSVLILQTADRAFVYWRLPQISDSLRLRSVTVRPAEQGPSVQEEDYSLSRAVGGFWLSRVAPGTEVRAAVGEVSADGFSPLTVARVIGDSDTPAFEPHGTKADSELEAAARVAAGL